jgi:hypothetical protein
MILLDLELYMIILTQNVDERIYDYAMDMSF